MVSCPNCGTESVEGANFCRQCGARLKPAEEATTWRFAQGTEPQSDLARTTAIRPAKTAEPSQPTTPAYVPPFGYYPPAQYQQSAQTGRVDISLGDWLARGWRVYKENWLLMSLATAFGSLLTICTVGILAGPILIGLYRMAFKSMREQRPEMSDLFNWEARFFQAFLLFLIFVVVHLGLTGVGRSETFAMLSFIVNPLLTVALALALPLTFERKMDVAAAINEVSRLIFSRDVLMWWVVGLVFMTIAVFGMIACFFGVFVTTPWIICSAAIAYSDIFAVDDPNRTLH
jgi:hypothetical protein